MRVLFTTWAWGSHYFPLVPLAWAMACAGHEVRVASAPAFGTVITQSGLPAVGVGPDIDVPALMRERKGGEISHPGGEGRHQRAKDGIAIFVEVAEQMADELVEFGRVWRPDLVVFEPTTFAGPLLAQLLGVPSARHLWTVDFTRRIDQFEEEMLGPIARRFGLDRVHALGDLTIDPCPPRLQIPEIPDQLERQLIRYVPYNGPAVLPDWLRTPPERSRVCLTWGTSLAGLGVGTDTFLVPELLAALASEDVEVIVTVVDEQRAQLRDVPDNARVVPRVALNLLLPSCCAVVHQGGGGSMMTSLVNGLPQLAVPQLPDQVLNSSCLATTGAGRSLPVFDLNPERLRIELHRVLHDPLVADQATALGEEMVSQPDAFEAVRVLEKLTL